MKRLEIIFLFLIILSSSVWATTYTGTKPKDLDITTPTESNTKISEFNNSDREIKTVITNLENITTVTGTYTVAGTQTGILGSSTSSFTISFPSASSVATGSVTKRYMIKNINTGTITLNLTVDGVGSPTVTGSQTFKLFTDGTSWFEERANTAANASNAGLLDNLDSTYFTNATNLSTGTVNLDRIPGTLTGKSADLLDEQTGSYYTNASNLDSGTIPLARIPTTLTGKDADTLDTIDSTGFVQTSRTVSTTAPLAGGGALSSNLTLSIPLATSGQDGYISSADWTTFNNKLSSSRTLYTTTPLTINNTTSADLSTDRTIAMATATASQDGFIKKEDFNTFNNKVNIIAGSGITSSGSTGTITVNNNGVLQVLAGSGISITNNGTGTPTITASGTSSAGGWTNTGTQTIAEVGLRITPQGTIAVHADYGITGLTDTWIPNDLSLDSLTLITDRSYDLISGTSTIKPTQIAIGTTTLQGALNAVGSATFSGTVTAEGFSGNGVGLTGITVDFSAVIGSMSSHQMTANPTFVGTVTSPIIALPGTTSSLLSGSNTIVYMQVESKIGTLTSLPADLIMKFNNPGSSTFIDSSPNNFAVTSVAGAIGTASSGTLGSAGLGLLANGDRVTLADNALWTLGTGNFTIGFRFRCDYITGQRRCLIAHYGATNDSWRVALEDPNTLKIVGIDSTVTQISFTVPFTPATGTTYIFEYNRTDASGQSGHHVMIDGSQKNTTLVAGAWTGGYNDKTGNLIIGGFEDTDYESHIGMIDNVYLINGEALHNGTYTTTSQEYQKSEVYIYNEYRTKLISPNNNLIMSSITVGTYSAVGGSSTTYFPGSTSVFGLAEGTDLGTITSYSGWFDGAVRATAFNVASTQEIKENIKDINIKPNLLDAEAEAKKKYINDNRLSWYAINTNNYTTVISEIGTGTITMIDKDAMEADYNDYIEIQWASDLDQGTYTANIQKEHEARFWNDFNSIIPRQWNPKGNPSLTRKGFVVEESPDQIKGDDNRSIDPMKVIAQQQKVLQYLKTELDELKAIINP